MVQRESYPPERTTSVYRPCAVLKTATSSRLAAGFRAFLQSHLSARDSADSKLRIEKVLASNAAQVRGPTAIKWREVFRERMLPQWEPINVK